MTLTAPCELSGSSETICGAPTVAREEADFQLLYTEIVHVLMGSMSWIIYSYRFCYEYEYNMHHSNGSRTNGSTIIVLSSFQKYTRAE